MIINIRRVWGQVARCWKYLTGGGVGVASFASRARPSRGRSARFVRVVGRPGGGSRVRPFSRVWYDLVLCVGCLRFWPRRPSGGRTSSFVTLAINETADDLDGGQVWRLPTDDTPRPGQGPGQCGARHQAADYTPVYTPRVYTPPGHNPRTCAPGAYAPGQCRPHERGGVHTARGMVGRPYHGPGVR